METVYIPRLTSDTQEEFVVAQLGSMDIADVHTIDWIPRKTATGCFYQAFVHLYWRDSPSGNSIKNAIENNGQRRVYYTENDYWIVLKAVSPRVVDHTDPHCINVDFPRLYADFLTTNEADSAVLLATIIRNAQNVQKFALDTAHCLAYYVSALTYKSQEAYGLQDHTWELSKRLKEVVAERDELSRQIGNITSYNAGIRERHEDKIERLERETRTYKNMLARLRHNNTLLRSKVSFASMQEDDKSKEENHSCPSESGCSGTSSSHAGEIEGWDIVDDATQDEFESD